MSRLQQEALRYMGYRQDAAHAAHAVHATHVAHAAPDPRLLLRMDDIFSQLESAAAFAYTTRLFTIEIKGDNVAIGGLRVRSASLAEHLRGCDKGLLFAATLGAAVDRLMLRLSATGMDDAVILQACAAAYLEQCADTAQQELAREYEPAGLSLWPRYSPGYGDFSLDCQRAITRMLDTGRRIGLHCTDGNMLTPTKSITAVIGLGRGQAGADDGLEPIPARRSPGGCSPAGCALCGREDCLFGKDKNDGDS